MSLTFLNQMKEFIISFLYLRFYSPVYVCKNFCKFFLKMNIRSFDLMNQMNIG